MEESYERIVSNDMYERMSDEEKRDLLKKLISDKKLMRIKDFGYMQVQYAHPDRVVANYKYQQSLLEKSADEND